MSACTCPPGTELETCEANQLGVVVKFPGHSTTVKGITVSELVRVIEDARRDGDGHNFVFLQGHGAPVNGVVIDPYKVEALYADQRRPPNPPHTGDWRRGGAA
jgi:hypothetical protein